MKPPILYPLGDTAAVVDFGGGISPATLRRVQALGQQLAQQPFPGLRETVPAYTTLTIFYDPGCAYEQVASYLRERLAEAPAETTAPPVETVKIPVCYGGECGPDLAAVAQHAGLSEAAVVARHAAPTYLVHMLGFLPGFAYLGGLDAGLATPRRASPRALVPAGTVGIAGSQTGLYPLTSPGGWQLIGRTPLRLFDAARTPPALLQAGQQLRFVPISAAEFQQWK